jgi:hypothetical protein
VLSEQIRQFAQERDPNAREAMTEPLVLVDLDAQHFVERHVQHALLNASRAPEIGIVREDRDAVLGQLHIALQVARPGFDRRPQTGKRVLGVAQGIAAMRDKLGRLDAHITG